MQNMQNSALKKNYKLKYHGTIGEACTCTGMVNEGKRINHCLYCLSDKTSRRFVLFIKVYW